MRRQRLLAEPLPDYAERRRRIEAEPLPANIGALLDEAAAEAGERAALDFFESGERLSYGELRERVDRLAAGMMSAGIGRGTHVAVMFPNAPEFPITWLALARLGAVMLPVNIAYTARELAYVLEVGAAEWLMIDEGSLPQLREMATLPPGLAADRIVVRGASADGRRSWADLAQGQGAANRAWPAVGHDDLLNIQFTSGTTGFPKGAMLSQIYWLVMGKQAGMRDGRRFARILASTPFFYMDPQWQLMVALYQRATLVVARRQSSSRYMAWVREQKIAFGLLPEIVLKQPPTAEDARNDVVRFNVYGLSKDMHQAAEERFDAVIRESYGMTEIGSALFMPMEAVAMVGSGSCGLPAPFRELRIMDAAGRPVGPGESGELQVRGRGILQGYYGNPEATKAAFDGEWFRTGDLFRRDEQGYFWIVGRLKDMIRRAGENISAREVEAVLLAMPEIEEAAVVGVKDETREEEVKAYLVLRPGTPADHDALARIISHCLANLAPFKVPRYVEFLSRMPKTASGKVAKAGIEVEAKGLSLGAHDRVSGT